jgi:hypothetical protein
MVWALAEDGIDGSIGLRTEPTGTVEHEGMNAGRYTLSASGSGGGFGCLYGVELVPGEDGPPLELILEPAAQLVLSVPGTGEARVNVQIRKDGGLIGYALLPQGNRVSVPPGALDLELVRWTPAGPETLQTRTVVARLGAETVVEFDAP